MFMNEALLCLLEVLTTPGDAGSVFAKQGLISNLVSASRVRAYSFILFYLIVERPGSKLINCGFCLSYVM